MKKEIDERETTDTYVINSPFFALMSRLRLIGRWGLMRNSFSENVQEHSHMVAILAHALAVIRRDIFVGTIDPDTVATAALFHDASEIFTGDLPTPIKYQNHEIMTAYKQVEHMATEKLLQLLPEALRPSYAPLLAEENCELSTLIKAADKLAAYIKCLEELKAGNMEFKQAEKQIKKNLDSLHLPELGYFMKHFLPAFELTLDELNYSL